MDRLVHPSGPVAMSVKVRTKENNKAQYPDSATLVPVSQSNAFRYETIEELERVFSQNKVSSTLQLPCPSILRGGVSFFHPSLL